MACASSIKQGAIFIANRLITGCSRNISDSIRDLQPVDGTGSNGTITCSRLCRQFRN